LNKIIKDANPEILSLLTERGMRAYYPNQGIIKQSLEAEKYGTKFNASIGIAIGDDNQPMVFNETKRLFAAMQIPLDKGITYGGSAGLQPLRERLKAMVGINGVGLPVITSGLTHALSNTAALFCDEDTAVVIHSFFWENIQLLFQGIFGSTFVAYPFYNAERIGFNLKGLEPVAKLPTLTLH
jgi:DNA-binding transcriptional MocR family regulator